MLLNVPIGYWSTINFFSFFGGVGGAAGGGKRTKRIIDLKAVNYLQLCRMQTFLESISSVYPFHMKFVLVHRLV